MADDEHLRIIKQGAEAWNAWRKAHPEIKPDLTGASLSGRQLSNMRMAHVDLSLATLKKTNFRGSDFWRTTLNLADLSGADLSRSQFGGSLLHHAKLSGTKLEFTRFMGTDLSNASMSHARIFRAHFIDSDLNGADFGEASMREAVFANVDLRKATGFDTVKYIGPSSVGIDSIYKSRGQIPTVFLRGCGVPEDFIRRIAALTCEAMPPGVCFICHSALDRVFAEKLHQDLQANGVRCWRFPDDDDTRKAFNLKLDEATRLYDKLIVVCSKHGLASAPVAAELERALEMEAQYGSRALICVTRDDFLANEWAHSRKTAVLETLASDFRHWEKPESYERALGKVLAVLKR